MVCPSVYLPILLAIFFPWECTLLTVCTFTSFKDKNFGRHVKGYHHIYTHNINYEYERLCLLPLPHPHPACYLLTEYYD